MPIDPSSIGQLSMRFLDHVTTEYGEEAELIRTMIVAEVRYPDPDDETTTKTTVFWDTDETSPIAKYGLIDFIAAALRP